MSSQFAAVTKLEYLLSELLWHHQLIPRIVTISVNVEKQSIYHGVEPDISADLGSFLWWQIPIRQQELNHVGHLWVLSLSSCYHSHVFVEEQNCWLHLLLQGFRIWLFVITH